MKRFLPSLVALAVLLVPGAAFADPVQEFSFQLRDVKPDGRYSLVFSSRSYDTSGAQPPQITENYLRLPRGVELRGAFLGKRYRCDVDALSSALALTPESGVNFTSRLTNLKATLARVGGQLAPAALANFQTCVRAQIGTGKVVIDARPYVADPVPANVVMFLARGTAKGAIASFGILAAPDETAAVVRDNPAVAANRSSFNTNIFKDPTSDGLYGYRMNLPSGPIAGLKISISEMSITTKGLSTTKQTVKCLRRRKGRCTKRQVKTSKIFWLTQPACPASGSLSFLAYYKFATGAQTTKTVTLPCPAFQP